MINNLKEDLKNKIYAKELIKLIYQKTNDLAEITDQANAILSKKELFVSKATVKDFLSQITDEALSDEKKTDALVQGMLKSIGQDLEKNQEAIEEKKLTFFDKNSSENHLRFCEVAVDKEKEAMQHG